MKKLTGSSKKKITNSEKNLQAETEAKLRLAAELENTRKRFDQERVQISARANSQLLEKIFPVFDNFYRAAGHAPEISLEDIPNLTEEDFKKISGYFAGLKMIESQMEQVLAEAGLKKVPTVGHEFDPNLHEALSHEPSTEVPEDAIIAEIESGWMLDDHVLKPAKVRVSKG